MVFNTHIKKLLHHHCGCSISLASNICRIWHLASELLGLAAKCRDLKFHEWLSECAHQPTCDTSAATFSLRNKTAATRCVMQEAGGLLRQGLYCRWVTAEILALQVYKPTFNSSSLRDEKHTLERVNYNPRYLFVNWHPLLCLCH